MFYTDMPNNSSNGPTNQKFLLTRSTTRMHKVKCTLHSSASTFYTLVTFSGIANRQLSEYCKMYRQLSPIIQTSSVIRGFSCFIPMMNICPVGHALPSIIIPHFMVKSNLRNVRKQTRALTFSHKITVARCVF
jgi:hypothetical protein